MLKYHDGVINLLCHYYFLLLLCLLDAHYLLFNLIVIKFCKFGFYCGFLSSNSKLFLMPFFWLAGKCGTPLFNNKPVSTWLSLKKLVSSRMFNLLSSVGNNFNDSFSKVPYASNLQKLRAFWSVKLLDLSERKLRELYLLLHSITPINTHHNFVLTLIGVPSLETQNPLWNKRSAW